MNRTTQGIALFATVIVAVLGIYYLPGVRIDKPKYGIVDRKKIFKTHPFFRESREQWASNRQTLTTHYQVQMKDLRTELRQAGFNLSMLRDLLSEAGNSLEQHPHRKAKSTGPETKAETGSLKRLRNQVKVITARKQRSDYVLQQKRERLLELGHSMIEEAVSDVADSQNLSAVYDRPDVIFRREKMNDQNFASSNNIHPITEDVLAHLEETPQVLPD